MIDITGLSLFSVNQPLTVVLKHSNGSRDLIQANHTYNESQIEWFKAGSALNLIRRTQGNL
jgi:aconitate hydratase